MPSISPEERAWRRQWLTAMTEATDAYLRSPLFLEAMKHSLSAMVRVQQSRKAAAAGGSLGDAAQGAAENASPADEQAAFTEHLRKLQEGIARQLAQAELRLNELHERAAKDSDSPAGEGS